MLRGRSPNPDEPPKKRARRDSDSAMSIDHPRPPSAQAPHATAITTESKYMMPSSDVEHFRPKLDEVGRWAKLRDPMVQVKAVPIYDTQSFLTIYSRSIVVHQKFRAAWNEFYGLEEEGDAVEAVEAVDTTGLQAAVRELTSRVEEVSATADPDELIRLIAAIQEFNSNVNNLVEKVWDMNSLVAALRELTSTVEANGARVENMTALVVVLKELASKIEANSAIVEVRIVLLQFISGIMSLTSS
jgi:hypothetical protein